MDLFILGMDHRTTPIALRERFALHQDVAHKVLARLKDASLLNEAFFLSTCNRAEVYAVTEDKERGVKDLRSELCRHAGVDAKDALPLWYVKKGPDALSHLFRVASSLDAMVVGEAQILGQIKDAYFAARGMGITGPFIDRAMLKALQVAKKIRTVTRIGAGQVSVASVAAELATRTVKDLSCSTVLVLGAGEMGALVARHLKKAGAGRIIVANRTYEKARMIAEHSGGEAIDWKDLSCGLSRADIVVSSTGSRTHVIDKKMISRTMASRKRPLVMIDLGAPRDIAPDAAKIPRVHLFNMDDLRKVTETNTRKRAREAKKAERLVDEESKRFFLELSSPAHLTAISFLGQKFQAICDNELERTLSRLPGLSCKERDVVESGARSIVSKILHDPVRELKSGDGNDLERRLLSDSLCRLFRLSEE